jgi:hypothetical protein
VLNEDFSILSPSSSPSPTFPSLLDTYAEVEKHIQACQDIFFDDVATRNKVLGIDVSNLTPNHSKSLPPPMHHPSHHHSNTSSLLPTSTPLSHNGHPQTLAFHNLDLDDEEDDDHMGHSLSSLTSHSLSHPLALSLASHTRRDAGTHHRDGGSNSSTDTEEGLSGYDLKSDVSLSGYDSFTNVASDPDVFLTSKSHHPDFTNNINITNTNTNNNNNSNNNIGGGGIDNLDGLDIIADDMPSEMEITKHTQDAPMHKQPHMGGLLNTHMLISPRHMMNV